MNKLPKHVTIAPITKVTFPDKIIFVDTETKQRKTQGGTIFHYLWFGCVLCWTLEKGDRREKLERSSFTSCYDFWRTVDEFIGEKESVYLFAHNVKFDFMVLDGFTHLPDFGFTLQSLYNKFTTTVMKFKNGKRALTVADSMNYFQTSLSKLAPMVGEKKIETDFDKPNRKEIFKRCESDVTIIYKAVRLIIDKLQAENLGGFRVTAPSVSFSIFRSRFLKDEITTHHNDPVVQMEKDAYYGGFVQVFKLFEVGKPNLYKLDINAMYPSVMKGFQYPIQLCDTIKGVTPNELEQIIPGCLVVADVTISCDKAYFPFRHDTGVYYPVGTYRTTLTTPSISFALKHGYIKEVHKVATYLSTDIFTEFVAYMYKQRMQAKTNKDIASEMFYKMMMNSLYGKFGQTAMEHSIVGECDTSLFESYQGFDVPTNESFREILAGGNVIQIREAGEARYTFYAIAAHVTDYARMKLFKLMDRAGRENVFYSDTDSLIVNETGYAKLKKELHPTDLGKLKVEDTGNVFIGFAKKDYLLGDKRKLKGFTLSSSNTDKHVFKSYQSSSFFGAMKRDEKKGSYWRMIEKIHNPYVRGTWIDEDSTLHPLSLPLEENFLDMKHYTIKEIKHASTKLNNASLRKIIDKWL